MNAEVSGCAQSETLERRRHNQILTPPLRGNPIRRAIAYHFNLPVNLLMRSYSTFAA